MTEQLKVIISAEVDKLKQGVKEAQGAVGTFKNEISKNKEAISQTWNGIGNAATTASKAMIGGVAAIGTALTANVAATEEYRTAQAKLSAAFETAGASADVAKSTYNDLYRVLGDGDVAVEAAGHLAQMTTNEKELAEWTNICQGVYATFGDSIPIEGLTEAANETAKVGQVTGSLADALNWAGVSEDDFNAKLEKCNSEAEREKLIRETLTGIYDEASGAYEKSAAEVLAQNEAQAKLQETLAKLGTAMAPVLTAFTSFATEALAAVTPHIQGLAEKYMPAFKDALTQAGQALAPIADFIANNIGVIATIAGIIMGISVAFNAVNGAMAIYNTVTTAHTAITTIATAAQTAFAAVNTAALAPILAVVAAIAAVIAIIVLCVKHWDEIKEVVSKVAKAVGEAVSKMVTSVVNFFTNLVTSISEKAQAIWSAVTTKFNNIKTSVTNAVKNAGSALKTGFDTMKSAASEKVSSIASTVSSKFNSMKDGIKTKINAARDAVKTAIDKMKGFFKFSWSLPKPKFPTFSVSGGKAPWGFMGQGSLPKISIKWNEMGGVFDKPTLFNYGDSLQGLGEKGAEAVVPLEKNTKWLDRIADMLVEKQGTAPIVLQVDGKTFAQISVDSINQLTRQRGSLALNLV